MRIAAFAFVSALVLGACGQGAPQAGQAPARAGALFPNLLQASYRAEAIVGGEDGRELPLVMIRDGRKLRIEINAPQGRSAIITNSETGESFIIAEAGGRQVAMRAASPGGQVKDPAEDWGGEIAASATRTGPCSGAGQSGQEWSRSEAGAVKTVCVTDDGIILRATDGGRVVWDTRTVERGPQSADLFALPAGVEVMDLGNVPGVADALARAKAAPGAH